jgi:hypothetical protein
VSGIERERCIELISPGGKACIETILDRPTEETKERKGQAVMMS